MSVELPREITTARLKLRRWRPEDLEPFISLSNDPAVMEFFPNLLSREECEASMARVQLHFEQHGFGYWAVEIPGVVPFAGLIGLAIPRFESHFTPCVELGWRLARPFWGQGLAPEGARASLDFAFNHLQLDEVVAMTAQCNQRSRRVMEKLGMTHTPDDDFPHPLVPAGHSLVHHVLYRIQRPER